MAHSPSELNTEIREEQTSRRMRMPWQKPEVVAAQFEETETGIQVGPEILVLLS